MEDNFRGDTLPIVVFWDDYVFQEGDEVTVGIFEINSKGNMELLKSQTIVVEGEAERCQFEFSREEMKDIIGEVIIEARVITNANVERTIQGTLNLREDGLR